MKKAGLTPERRARLRQIVARMTMAGAARELGASEFTLAALAQEYGSARPHVTARVSLAIDRVSTKETAAQAARDTERR